MTQTAFEKLIAYQRQTEVLKSISGLLSWDSETKMGSGSAQKRGEQLAVMSGMIHDRNSATEIADLVAAARQEVSTPTDQRHVDLIARDVDRAQRLPKDLAMELSRARIQSGQAWAEARENETPDTFLPHLAHIVKLVQEQATALRQPTDATLYDVLLHDYEPDASVSDIDQMFTALRPGLVDLRAAAMAAPPAPTLSGHFDPAGQEALANDIATRFGYDLTRGRIDVAVHPFCEGSGDDVRITTRYDDTNPLDSLYSIIHEVGHAVYEQNVAAEYQFTVFGGGVSMGVHESQSRLYENQLGRSRAFTGWLYGRMRDTFGDIGVSSEDAFYRAVNAVKTGYIRTEADEVHYNLHVLLRYDLEKALVHGDLTVHDLEAAWNDRFLADFGISVDRPSHGFLQDIHWSEALIGYFPTYTLGNVYAACLFDAMQRDVPLLDQMLAAGQLSAAQGWLSQAIHHKGGSLPAGDLITHACGHAPCVDPLLAYLDQKFTALTE